ncbi:biphenyl 2,3-dioxygenase beta subunit [Sphingobium wenxiniae]|jgi:biphenyl 2,3-dioxygenase beta subunit|uniref:Biphenyl 2,3-dioxygenase beta subunit n=3 Tax=Sphingomonadales TaxID=204457 RepID=A0A562K3U5_SPHWJ|nr:MULTISPECIES: aromatic-ring-hydroxylating dioxygenase subunit beta [Alphaproteobacteria]MBB6193373.1 biphenyl 2,3-dioxygenase beta subunit [Sphingobium wenxiniae]OHT17793.1 Biphenyl dioxygenase subunit beta [Sphingomonas haloaromaticamans]RSU47770.1 benzene 1,2-dioxygenase [Sphingobium yanoikuyae]TAJ33615.1 MAG: 3-phenylpropionate/cinnamic acid dioxygenase subunit beta [Bosea sp. (in: a-proteobacteria)]TWH90099.1 biphenyl 2,3-dioxygenase beta subunit [Sphingobium wenxiniae]
MQPNKQTRVDAGRVGVELQHEVEQFLYREAALLDNRRFEEWIDLLADDIRYFMPLRTNRSRREQSLEYSNDHESAYFDDDKQTMKARVRKLRSSSSWSEDPPSRTRHLVSNVLIEPGSDDMSFVVSAAVLVYRGRLERQVDIISGERRDILRRADNALGFQIAARTFLIDQATLLANNISFFI